MRERLSKGMFWTGAAMLLASLAFAPQTFGYDAKTEWNGCKQERRMATLNDAYSVSDRCRELDQRSNIGFALLIGGFALLAVSRSLKRKKAE